MAKGIKEQTSIVDKRAAILDRMAAAAKQVGRQDIPTLVAVSKVQPDSRIQDMLETGQKVFGENRVQEAQTRWSQTFKSHRDNVSLHLIGPLQTNKAEDAVKLFDVIETVDREKLIKALLKAAEKVGTMPRFFVQVNTGEEPQKSGILPQDLSAFLARLKSEYNQKPSGLMCIPPLDEAPSPHFWLMQKMAEKHELSTISMGMSGDYETAIAMGATHIRVGSALFGARNYA